MKITVDGTTFSIDLRFVKGIRWNHNSRDSKYSCLPHMFMGTKMELRNHLKEQHPEIFTMEGK